MEKKHLTLHEIMISHCLLARILVLITRLKSILLLYGTPVNYPVTMREVSWAWLHTYNVRPDGIFRNGYSVNKDGDFQCVQTCIISGKVIPQHQQPIKWAPDNIQITVIWWLFSSDQNGGMTILCVGHVVTVRKSNVNSQRNQNTLSLFCLWWYTCTPSISGSINRSQKVGTWCGFTLFNMQYNCS